MADNKKQTAKEKSKDAAQAANLAFIQQLMSQGKNVEVVAGDAPEDAAPQEQPQDDVPQQEQATEAARDQASAEEPVAEEPAAPEEEMDQDAIDAMMAARAAKKAEGAQEETSTEEPVAEEPAAPEEEMDQDAIDAMMAARAAKKAGGAQEEAPAEEQASAEEPAADEEMDQDAIDAMMAARAAKKAGGAQEETSTEEPVAEEPAAPEEEMDQDAIDAMMAARAAKKAGGAQEETSTEEPVAEEPAAPEEEMDQDAIDAMMAARAAKKAGGAQEEAPAEEQASAEEPAADEEMDQDAIDAMMAARAAKKAGGAQEETSTEEPVAEEPAAPEEEMDQDAIDAMMAARAAKKAGGAQEEAPAEEQAAAEEPAADEEMDQDAIDAMMAARAAKKAGGAQEEAPAEEQAAAEEPAADEEMDQDAIDAMMAARAAKKSGGQQEPAEEPKEAELDQSAIDAMMAARTAKKTSEPEPQEEEKEAEVDQDAIDAMMAQRAQAKKAGPKASAKPKEEPQAKAADSEEDGIPVGFMAKLKVAQGSHALRKLSLAHLLFLSNGLLVVVILVGLLFFLSRKSNQPRTVIAEVAVPADSNHSGPATVEPRKLVIPEVGPTTWTEAERAFAARKWDLAFARYQKLMEDAQSTWENQMVIDLLRMRSGQCLIRLSQIDLGREMLVRSTRSASPIVRAFSNYRLGKLRSTQGLHMQARTRSFMAVAALGMLDMPSPLEVDCDYLIARCMTEKVLSYHNPDRDIPTPRHEEYDPFVGLSEGDLVRFLSEGAQRLNRSVLGPVVKLIPPGDNLNASCWRAPLKEYLHRFEAETGIDVRWVNVSPDARRRPVTVYLDKVSFERAAEVGTGVVGLVSRLSGATVEVHDVQAEESMGQTRSLIREEAISAWRQFFLRQPEDVRVPSGRLSLARIYEAGDDALAAIREYQLIASRFPRHLAAPEAIMRSAQLRIRMLDYPGARKDLIKLLDTYPDYEATDDLYLSLGRASLNAGMFEEAVGVFRKLYYLNLSPESQAGACLGLGKCYFGQKNYVEAARWLKRYLKQTYKTSGDELCEAMELMGKCHMAQGDPKRAVQYLLPAVSMDSSLRRDISATLTLAEAAMADENYVRAVGAVDRIDTQRVPDEQMYDFLRIKADVYSGMGLYRRALRTLRQGIDNTQNSRMRARLGYQMARNYIRASEYPMAHAVLTEVLGSGKLAPGAESQNAAVDLGEVCMLMDRPDQAISAVRSVAAASEDKKLRRRASKVLGAAYVMKQEYDKAAMAYAGQLPQQKGVSQP